VQGWHDGPVALVIGEQWQAATLHNVHYRRIRPRPGKLRATGMPIKTIRRYQLTAGDADQLWAPNRLASAPR
jgi:hypothetical protein